MSNDVEEIQRLLVKPAALLAWPLGSKGTKLAWKHRKPGNVTPEYLAKLAEGNIGVALGDISGGLCAIDADTDDFAEKFSECNPHLKETLQTHGARGRNFWVRFEGDYPRSTVKLKTASGEDLGELRSNGAQSIIAGIHPSGKPYEFTAKMPVLTVAFDSIIWPDMVFNPPVLQRNRSRILGCSASSVSPSLRFSVIPSVTSIERAVEISLPEREHSNNAALFKLARAMLTLKATLKDQIRAFELWYHTVNARGLLRPGQTKDDYKAEFFHACQKAKTPLGDGQVERAWNLAQIEPLPEQAHWFDTRDCKLLVALCWQLEKSAHGKPWFLSTRTAAKIFGKKHTQIAPYFTAMVHLGIIETVENHTATKAPRYRFVAGGK